MRKATAILLLCALFLSVCAPALASNFYIIPDSHTRRLTEEELWGWEYDALGYILNEIFARHGFHFKPGGKYYNYFNAQVWYQENTTYATNEEIYHHLVTSTEWTNEHLVKVVREQMRAMDTTNPGGKTIQDVSSLSYEPPLNGIFSTFALVPFAANQRMPVFSGPGEYYYRAANGKAVVSTNGLVYVGGVEDGWLMVAYWLDSGARIGYVKTSSYKDQVTSPFLQFAYTSATIGTACKLTDDPIVAMSTVATLPQGTQVTYLSEYINSAQWAYIETSVNGQPTRGFIPSRALQHASMEFDIDYK